MLLLNPAANQPTTCGRRRWLWLALLGLGSCQVPSFEDYARRPLKDAGTAVCAGGACCDGGPCAPPVCDGGACCDGGPCGPPSCAAGFADCNGNPDDGCETALDSVAHCGGCGVECRNGHGLTACMGDVQAGNLACTPTCAVGFADCDLDPANGCETDINSDSTHCGSCTVACPANGGTPHCLAGECGISSCNPGFGDCENVGACRQNLNTDPNNCGHCGHVCSNAHGTPSCNGGTCQIGCDAGWGDCNGAALDAGSATDDGCETKLNITDSNGNVANCGACGMACNRRSLTTVNLAQCALGVCSRDCFAAQGDCDNNRNDPGCRAASCGCETPLGNNVNDCGACGHVCKGGSCINQSCECPDTKPTSGSTKCSLASTVMCGPYGTSCTCSCQSGVFKCTDSGGKAC